MVYPSSERGLRATPRLLGRAANWLLVGLTLLGTTALLGSSTAEAQPSRRDKALRTPTKLKLPGGGTPGGRAGSKGSGAGSGKNAGGAGAGSNVFKKPALEYRPGDGKPVNFNLNDVDLPELVEAISQLTGRRFIFGGKLRKLTATVRSPTKVSAGEAYMAFLSVLETNGLTVVPHGRYLKIVETAGVVSQTTPIIGTAEPVPYVDRFVTRLYRLKYISANEVSGVLSKFKSKNADITVYEPSNLLIITDTGANIRRMLRLIEELDAGGAGEQIWIQPVHNMAAADVAAKLTELLELGGNAGNAKIIADERNNAVIMVATESDYERLLDLIKRVDVPASGAGGIHVLPLQHARCEELSQTLSQIVGGSAGGAARSPARTAARGSAATRRTTPRASGGGAPADVFEGEVRIACDEATNTLLTTSSLRDYAQLRNVIDRLDRPRRQVFIEAVIMDVNVDHTRDLGLGFHGGANPDGTLIYGGSNAQQSLTGIPANLEALAFGVRGPEIEGTANLLGTGLSIPAFGVVLHALATSGDSNVLATPHILATDNIPAEISIGQNIPLQTGIGGGISQLAGLAGGQAGALGGLLGGGGFQAPRQDVGIRLRITSQINDSDQVRMEISEEISDAGSPTGALEAVPINKRTAETTVIVKDQQTVVIGGLVRESQVNGETKIPVLGDIPVLGLLFRRTVRTTQKTNLLLIITPHIVRNQNDLRAIFERKMQERQEFLDRYFVFDDSLPWEPAPDYSRTNGMLEHIRQTQLAIAERERLAAEIAPKEPKTHEHVQPVALPSMAAPQPTSSVGGRGRKAPAKTTRKKKPRSKKKPRFKVPGSVLRKPNRYRVE